MTFFCRTSDQLERFFLDMLANDSLKLFREDFVATLSNEINRVLIGMNSKSPTPIVSVHCHYFEFADFIREVLLQKFGKYIYGNFRIIFEFFYNKEWGSLRLIMEILIVLSI